MKTKVSIFLMLVLPLVTSAQKKHNNQDELTTDKPDKNSKGFYINLNLNPLTSFDKSIEGGISAGFVGGKQFYVGADYRNGGTNDAITRINKDFNTREKYSKISLQLMLDPLPGKAFTVMPFLNAGFVSYKLTAPDSAYINTYHLKPGDTYRSIDHKDNFFCTEIGAKAMYKMSKGLGLSLSASYNILNGVNLYSTKAADLSGLNVGLTLHYSFTLPKAYDY